MRSIVNLAEFIRHQQAGTVPFKLKIRPKPKDSSAFSEFIRNASSKEKKRVYTRVIKKSIESQKRILDKAVD